ncbi:MULTISPECIES: cyclodeaminase/cyclohydrolase family protein [unclassified Blautia]|uniref:cyclodeaminase/cyclohydrolase family protein n=1 Tax=unclassified Blautia TaxID=2648079 RepID=UPI000B370A49|nr:MULTISPECIES: cyclodeaminase/cyclohydrolase family protein [unclassified Blautia]OUN30846.1 methenyltetrahydrofolate cyclohydrolase [Blautia sp. An81]OUN90265.1 methenyltetrahydrofolate cyclohydrolase [Blautia sp. An46]
MKNMTIQEFAMQTASNEPVPGGGSISALAGSLAAALTEMVAGLTIGKKKYADVEEEMKEAVEPMKAVCAQLLDDIKRDSESFDQYMQALTLPKETEEEKAARTEAMQNGLKAAVEVPLSVAKAACGILPYAETMVVKGNKTAVTDALVATMMARTAVLGAGFNVKINLESIKDQEYVDRIGKEVAELEKQAIEQEKKILAQAQVSRSAVE